MSGYPISGRQGKGTIVVGVAAIAAGFAVQAANVYSVAQTPGFLATSNFGRAAMLSEIAWLLILCGVVVTIIGGIRYAQSGPSTLTAAGVERVHAVASQPAPGPHVASAVPVAAPAFCSACGTAIAGEGRFCSSCGASTAR